MSMHPSTWMSTRFWFRRFVARLGYGRPPASRPRPSARRFRPGIEGLEDRTVPTTFSVTTTADAGPGSLRQAITDANLAANVGGPDRIEFHIDVSYANADGTFTISPQTLLPQVTDPVVIDGYTQYGAHENTLKGVGKLGVDPGDLTQYGDNAVLKVQLDGRQVISNGNGLYFYSSATTVNGSVVQGLVVDGFNTGILAGPGVTVRGNFIGTNVTGESCYDSGNHFLGNAIGVVAAGGAQPVTIGGTAPGDRNLISGSSDSAVFTYNNAIIQGNFIGADHTGTQVFDAQNRSLGNLKGVYGYGSYGTFAPPGSTVLVGGTQVGAGNLISSSSYTALMPISAGFVIQGNFLGTDVTGTRGVDAAGRRLGNGLGIEGGSSIVVGGLADGAGNLLEQGIRFSVGASGSVVQGNYLGTNVMGGRTDAAGHDVFSLRACSK